MNFHLYNLKNSYTLYVSIDATTKTRAIEAFENLVDPYQTNSDLMAIAPRHAMHVVLDEISNYFFRDSFKISDEESKKKLFLWLKNRYLLSTEF